MTTEIQEGQLLTSYAFGEVAVRRLYKHPDTRETVADVKVLEGYDEGAVLHLSLAYCNKLMEVV